ISEEAAAEEEQAIESADNLEELAEQESEAQGVPVTFTIVELRFGDKTIQSGTNDTITVDTNAIYTFGFALRVNGGERDGMIIYHYIDSVGVTYGDADFDSRNSKITKTAEGFSVSNEFYSDETADINVTINYKNISGRFSFSLKSNKERPRGPESPAAQTQVREIREKIVDGITITMGLVLPPDTVDEEWKIVGNEVHALPEAFGYNRGDTRKIYVKLTISGASNNDFNGDYYLDKNNGRAVAFKGIPPNVDFNDELSDYIGTVDTVVYPQDSAPVVGATMTDTYTTISIQGTTFNLMKDYKVRIVSSL
ncbi:MAG: hypothetical protein LBH29_00705, partial [Elusimicrobiota bacterium]|nr:hypothetical protein [Elusimicrobiota bacterium]